MIRSYWQEILLSLVLPQLIFHQQLYGFGYSRLKCSNKYNRARQDTLQKQFGKFRLDSYLFLSLNTQQPC